VSADYWASTEGLSARERCVCGAETYEDHPLAGQPGRRMCGRTRKPISRWLEDYGPRPIASTGVDCLRDTMNTNPEYRCEHMDAESDPAVLADMDTAAADPEMAFQCYEPDCPGYIG